jgi:putative ABC transport system permease protein
MFKNNFKITWRSLMKDRLFTILNILGLSTGLACTMLIFLWITDERGVDKYNEKDEQLYQVMSNIKTDAGIKTGDYTPGILAPAMALELPEVEYAVSVLPASWFPYKGAISNGDKVSIKAGGQYVSKDYFNVFTCKFIEGDKRRLFGDRSSVAISTTLAGKLFGTTRQVVGRTLRWDQQEFSGTYLITGVFEPNPVSATNQFDLLFNYELLLEKRPNLLKWGNSDPQTYLLLKKGADLPALNEKVKDFVKRHDKEAGSSLFVTRFSDRYLYGKYENGRPAGGRITYLRLFSIIGIFILLIACVNFMNLSTAKASHRIKEVGIKKVMGARPGALVLQYLGESLLMAFLSALVAVILIILLLPAFNQLAGKQLPLPVSAGFAGSFLATVLLTGLIAGSYPACYLSKFNPVSVLKGKLRSTNGELWIRKGLVVFQFTLSIVFIAAVIIVYRQLSYIQARNLGYSRDNIIHFEIPLDMDSTKLATAGSFLNELKGLPGVVNASSYYHNLLGDHGSISGFEWAGKEPGIDVELANLEVGYNFLETAGIKIREGRNFTPNPNAQNEIIFNESAVRSMGLKNPVGKTVKFWGMEKKVVGIAADFNFESLYNPVKPCFFQVYPVLPNIMVKISPGAEKQTLAAIQKAYSSHQYGSVLDYRYLDEDYQLLYNAEEKIGVLSRYFAGLAVLISCLGLFGLTAFSAQRRQKEIGIRKVIGASVGHIALLVSKEFVILVLIALIIAFPLVWSTMNNWLNGFAYRVSINAGVFGLTAAAALLITIFTVSYQAITAAAAKPVNTLRME